MTRVCFVIFGENAASEAFVARKVKKAESLGVESVIVREKVLTTEEALAVLQRVVAEWYEGIVVQLPLPVGLDTTVLINAVPVEADVDLLSEESKKLFREGKTDRLPPVAYAVKTLLEAQNVDLKDKKIVLLGMGRLVGEPVSMWLEREGLPHAKIDINTSEGEKLEAIKQADVLISGIGVPHYVQPGMIKTGAVLIDAGTSSDQGRLAGDIDPSCTQVVAYLSPVPGGVGPLTVEGLFKNLFLK